MESVQHNPYTPPATNGVSKTELKHSGQQFALATSAIFVWSVFAAWFCFGGRRFGVWMDAFGFGGMALCVLGPPVIGMLLVKQPSRSKRILSLCLLDILGLLVFVAGVRMQMTGSSRDVWWLMYTGMGLVMIGLTYCFNLRSAKGESS